MDSKNSLIEKLIDEKPKFHVLPGGTLTSWAVSSDVLRFIYSKLTPDMTTLETGAGHSTVVFAIAGTNHTCITRSEAEVAGIRQYCSELGLGGNVNFLIGSSDVILPCNNQVPLEIDFAFIDGAHKFPLPCIDWYYMERKLKVGGIIGVDDFKMPSVRVLIDFLKIEDEWELIRIVRNAAFFRKVREYDHPYYWRSQRFNTDDESWRRKSLISRVKAWVTIKLHEH
jgi:predicted O-methyltransferase YrrM